MCNGTPFTVEKISPRAGIELGLLVYEPNSSKLCVRLFFFFIFVDPVLLKYSGMFFHIFFSKEGKICDHFAS